MRMTEYIELGSGNKFLLLAPVNAFSSAAPLAAPSIADFNKYYCIPVTHDQIKLAALATKVARQAAHALAQQELFSLAFGLIATLLTECGLFHGSSGMGANWLN